MAYFSSLRESSSWVQRHTMKD
jgi:NAD(P)-dependent dehydrogenase (short-subunit alcohol dehydrogenase family)